MSSASNAQPIREWGRSTGRIYAVNGEHLVVLPVDHDPDKLPPGFRLATADDLEIALEAAHEAGVHESEAAAFNAAAAAFRAARPLVPTEPPVAADSTASPPGEPSAGDHASAAFRTPRTS